MVELTLSFVPNQESDSIYLDWTEVIDFFKKVGTFFPKGLSPTYLRQKCFLQCSHSIGTSSVLVHPSCVQMYDVISVDEAPESSLVKFTCKIKTVSLQIADIAVRKCHYWLAEILIFFTCTILEISKVVFLSTFITNKCCVQCAHLYSNVNIYSCAN